MEGFRESSIDEIGYWSEVKLDLIKCYAQEYSKILTSQKFSHVYVDAFAGVGVNISRTTGDFVLGSAVNALHIDPPFQEYHLIDIKGSKVALLRRAVKEFPVSSRVHIHHGDCNQILLDRVFPNVKWKDFRRALCLLDPYGMHLDWKVIETAGEMQTIDMFLNFPIMDICRNALRKEPNEEGIRRMDSLWGDSSWRETLFDRNLNLFDETVCQKISDAQVVKAFSERIKKVAGFKHVSDPLPLRNSVNRVLFYLVLASQKAVATEIIKYIFEKFGNYGSR
jgi:three-Cys-motif partner protein